MMMPVHSLHGMPLCIFIKPRVDNSLSVPSNFTWEWILSLFFESVFQSNLYINYKKRLLLWKRRIVCSWIHFIQAKCLKANTWPIHINRQLVCLQGVFNHLSAMMYINMMRNSIYCINFSFVQYIVIIHNEPRLLA